MSRDTPYRGSLPPPLALHVHGTHLAAVIKRAIDIASQLGLSVERDILTTTLYRGNMLMRASRKDARVMGASRGDARVTRASVAP